MIDVFLKFTDKATAVADAVVATQYVAAVNGVGGDWLRDHVTEVSVYRSSQDTTQSVTLPDGTTGTQVVHHPLAGFYVLVSLKAAIPALANHAAVQVAIDRDKANARQAGAVLKSAVSNAILQDLRIDGIFAGSNYPWGAWT